MKYAQIKEIKQTLRNNPTPSEKILWKYIRNRQLLGRKFLRQHAIVYQSIGTEYFFFVPDFYCEAEKLAIELDGKIHEFTKQKDAKRDEIITSMDILTIRIRNEELKDMGAVIAKIMSCFRIDNTDPAFRRQSFKI